MTICNRDELINWLTERIARELSVSRDQIQADEPLANYGLDSVQVLTIVGDLEKVFGTRIHPSVAWEYPTIEMLADHSATTEPAQPQENRLSPDGKD